MPEWQFPNAIAESVARTAALRGQNPNRLEIRDFDDRWPPFERVSPTGRCGRASELAVHEGSWLDQRGRRFFDPFCRHCGALVDSRQSEGA